ncbi:MAG: extracellular solute-binding protein, partial [Gammaproteobacteria bacterium]|nr:extracellular solute-binding protein [Gammaproteobacteria bacterium]
MMMNNKKFIWLSLTLIVLFLLAACSSPEEAETPTDTPAGQSEEEQPSASTEEEPVEDRFAGEELTLIYFDATYAQAAEAVIPEFEEMTGAKVTLVTAPYASLYEKTFTDLVTGGGAYDVMQVASQWDGQFARYMASIDGYLANDPDVDINDFIPGVARVTGIWDGVRFGIPNADDAYGIIYRTDIFEEAGIEVDPENWTWEEYASIAEQLTTDEMHGTAIAGVKHQLDAYWIARYWSQGGHLMTQDWATALPERDTAVQSLQMLLDLMPYMPSGVMSYDIPDENNAFLQGKVAMAELWPSLIRGTANDPEQSTVVGKWGVLPYPGHSPQLSSWSLGIPETSENKDLAWEWIKFYTQDSKQRQFLDEFGVGPSLQAIYEDPAVIEEHPDFPNMLISLNGVRPRFRIAQSQETFDFLDDRISDALTGVMTTEEAVQAVVDQWEEKIGAAVPDTPYTDDYVEGGQVLAPASEPAEEAAEEIELDQFAGEELTLIYFDATYAQAAEAVIPEFEEATGATVILVTAPYASLYEKEFTDLVTSGGAYDVMQVASQWDGQFARYMASIDGYLANDPDVAINDFIPGVARVTGVWDGVRFGIPNADDAYGIIYRTDIFEEAGIEVDPENWTWEEYASIAEQLTTDEMHGTAIAGVKHQLDAYWIARYWSQGGHLMTQDWATALPER